ncbi:hypothetical protein [Candidatus Parabeggiatoa sp. HSG14]|uniref:hypothetical protein n=1 Tax=Candidatus Parabeggiatoa sp. HSG14 TaxID=3055593 RepID=UPI0025A7CCB3|nr:hypothetical protein [Thiotrichales bacterium HSG14]
MDVVTVSFLYLLIFRLSIVMLAAMSIFLGYSLFVKGITAGGEGSEMGVKVGGMGLNLKGAAPGTFFAAFGVIIVAVMMADPPSFKKIETINADGTKTITTETRDVKLGKMKVEDDESTTKDAPDDKSAQKNDNYPYLVLVKEADKLYGEGKYKDAAKKMREAVKALEEEDALAEQKKQTELEKYEKKRDEYKKKDQETF